LEALVGRSIATLLCSLCGATDQEFHFYARAADQHVGEMLHLLHYRALDRDLFLLVSFVAALRTARVIWILRVITEVVAGISFKKATVKDLLRALDG
jgi:hypothetical protein